MTSQSSSQTAQQPTGKTAKEEIANFFKMAAAMRVQPRLRDVTGVCRFDIEGAGSWSAAINDGEVTVIEGAGNALRPDCVISVKAEDFLHILHREGYLNMLTAGMQGLLTMSGDHVFAMAFLGSVVVAPDGVVQR